MTTRGSTRDGFDRKLLAPLISGAVLNPVNSTVIAVALVPIGVAFGQPASATAWLISALYLATAVGQPVAGRLIDRYGPRRLFLPATALVGVAGVLGTFAPNLVVLIVARVVLGFGTCAGYPAAMRLIRDESDRTGRDSPAFVLTLLAISTQTIAVIGPALGGLLIAVGGWQATFALNIPIAVAAFVLGARRFPKAAKPASAASFDLDVPGMTLFAGGLVTLLLFLMHPQAGTWYLAVIAAAAAAGFAARELTHAHPFIDLRLLGRNGPLLRTYGRALLAYVVSYSFIYGYTQWLEHSRGLSAAEAGLATLPLFATGIVVSLVSGRREAVRGKLVVAAIGQLAGCALLLTLDSSAAIWLLVVIAVVTGVPQGLNSLALQNSVYRQANPADIAASAGLLRTFGYLGAIVSSALQGALFGPAADTGGLHHLALLLLGIGAIFLIVTVFDRSLNRSTTRNENDEDHD
ncbi:MFS transporter [Amycolatopsis sp. NBC_01488]|uniref:MFS transporter n=1 Tax=Amycolatopsis sp. NBC_01488 TaxID=2903563 RepID=UPI002E2A0F16|nr:MFS transporter [Amycolatopsis sp. NBC_01488]